MDCTPYTVFHSMRINNKLLSMQLVSIKEETVLFFRLLSLFPLFAYTCCLRVGLFALWLTACVEL